MKIFLKTEQMPNYFFIFEIEYVSILGKHKTIGSVAKRNLIGTIDLFSSFKKHRIKKRAIPTYIRYDTEHHHIKGE